MAGCTVSTYLAGTQCQWTPAQQEADSTAGTSCVTLGSVWHCSLAASLGAQLPTNLMSATESKATNMMFGPTWQAENCSKTQCVGHCNS